MNVILVLSFIVSAWLQADTQALQRMVATERAFAAATDHVGIRDGFLTFLADDAIHLEAGSSGPDAVISRAKDAFAGRPLVKLPVGARLMWEPFTGQVSADGTIGWLTGSYVSMDVNTTFIAAQGAYFSVWKRQQDGTWRVWLDAGVTLPSLWQDASPFRVMAEPEPLAAGRTGASPVTIESIDDVEAAVGGGGSLWLERLSAGVRIHREGRMPIVGSVAAALGTAIRTRVVRIERAQSDDLAVALGGYEATVLGRAEHGTWVRVWKRDVTGRWQIVFQTSRPSG